MGKISEFFKFLKENDALENFINANPHISTNPRKYISGSFSWHSSEQGFDYWKQLHDKWVSYLESHVFLSFLVKNNALIPYILNFNECSVGTFSEFIRSEFHDNFISSAFTWASTPEGFDYWKELNVKWMQLLNS